MNKTRILIVDDHLVVREGLKLIFETEDIYEIIGEAANGEEAIIFLDENEVDIMLLDLSMPKMNGIELLEHLHKNNCSIPVIILTTIEDKIPIRKAINLGAKGYLLKDASREQLFRTVDAALRGEILFQQHISKVLFTHSEDQEKLNTSIDMGITERELFVLKGISKGNTSKKIAIEMGISERTVKAHLTNIYAKLGVNSRSEAVAAAIAYNIIHV